MHEKKETYSDFEIHFLSGVDAHGGVFIRSRQILIGGNELLLSEGGEAGSIHVVVQNPFLAEGNHFEADVFSLQITIEPQDEIFRLSAQLLQMFDDPQLLGVVLDLLLDLSIEEFGDIAHALLLEIQAEDVTHHRGHHQFALLLRGLEPLDELEDLQGATLPATRAKSTTR